MKRAHNPGEAALLYGVGSADNIEQVSEKIMYNALGNKYVRKIPVNYLPQPAKSVAQEYLSRNIPELIKDYYNNNQQ